MIKYVDWTIWSHYMNITKYNENIRDILIITRKITRRKCKGFSILRNRILVSNIRNADVDASGEQIAGPAIRSERVIVYVHRCHKSFPRGERQRDRRYELAKGIRWLGLENSSMQSHVNTNLGIDWYKRKLRVNLWSSTANSWYTDNDRRICLGELWKYS